MITKKWRMKRIRLKPCNDWMELSDDIICEILELREKEKMKHLNWEFSHRGLTPEEIIHHLDQSRIRIMLCVSFTNLNQWQATNLAYYLFFLKRLTIEIAQLGKVFHEPPVGFGNNEWIDMKMKEEESWTNHRKNWKWK